MLEEGHGTAKLQVDPIAERVSDAALHDTGREPAEGTQAPVLLPLQVCLPSLGEMPIASASVDHHPVSCRGHRPSLLELCHVEETGDVVAPAISDEVLTRMLQELLPNIDELARECDELLSMMRSGTSGEALDLDSLYGLTQLLIDRLGSRDEAVVDRIGWIYSIVEHGCQPNDSIGPIAFRGYVASVLTQILHELEARAPAPVGLRQWLPPVSVPSSARRGECQAGDASRNSFLVLVAVEGAWLPRHVSLEEGKSTMYVMELAAQGSDMAETLSVDLTSSSCALSRSGRHGRILRLEFEGGLLDMACRQRGELDMLDDALKRKLSTR